jgi:hypothetical protein
VLASVFSYDHLPNANLPGHLPINLGDAVLGAAVLGTWWRRPWDTWPQPLRRMVVMVGAMLVFASISSITIALQSRNGLHWAIYGYKNFLYLLVAAPIVLELSGRYWRQTLNVAVIAAAIVSILSIASAASPAIANLLSHFSPTVATSAASSFASAGQTVTTSAARIRLPGLFFAYAMLIPTLVMTIVVKDRWQLLRGVTVVLILGAVGVSLNRNMYAGTIMGLLVTLLLGGPRLRHRMLLVLATSTAAVALLTVAAVSSSVTGEVATRASSALSLSQVVSSSSTQARVGEFSAALRSIERHPINGVGWTQNYGAYDSSGNQLLGVEDLPLDLATDDGIPAAIAFLLIPCFLLMFATRSVRDAKQSSDRMLVAASAGATVALLLSSLVGTYGQEPISTLALGIAYGLLIASSLRAVRPPDDEAAPPPPQPRAAAASLAST